MTLAGPRTGSAATGTRAIRGHSRGAALLALLCSLAACRAHCEEDEEIMCDVDGGLELLCVDLDGELDLVPLEGFDGGSHAEGECTGGPPTF